MRNITNEIVVEGINVAIQIKAQQKATIGEEGVQSKLCCRKENSYPYR